MLKYICDTRSTPLHPAQSRSCFAVLQPGYGCGGPFPALRPGCTMPAKLNTQSSSNRAQHAQNPVQWLGQTERSSFAYRSSNHKVSLTPPVSCRAEIRPGALILQACIAARQICRSEEAPSPSWHELHLQVAECCWGRADPATSKRGCSGGCQPPQHRWGASTGADILANIYISVLCIP